MVLFSDHLACEILVLVACICLPIYGLLKYKQTYWARNGHFKSYPNPNILFGHFGPTFRQKVFVGELAAQIYSQTREPFVGIYAFATPLLLVCDPQVARNIFVADFQYFGERAVHCDEINDPLSGHLVALPYHKWKRMRGKLSPAFTTGRLKAMVSTLVDCGSSVQNHLKNLCDMGASLDIQEIAASYTTNVIASVAFGIDVDAIKDPNTEFRICGRKIFEPSVRNGLRSVLNFYAPKVMNLFGIKYIDRSVEKFFISVVKQNLEYRETNNVTRKDFFQLLIQIRNSGVVDADNEWKTIIQPDESQKTLSVNEIAAQVFGFFGAGFETSATTMTFCMYELAKSPKIQSQVVEEIDRVLQQHDGNITFTSVSEMKYLDACVDETLRKYPVASLLSRLCLMDYKIPGTDKVIEKGTDVVIPILAMQRDEKYYDEPDKFDPGRFFEESPTERPYFSFGDGPRNCIGKMLGKLETKVGIVLFLRNYKYELISKADVEFEPKAFLLGPKDRIELRVIKR